MKSHTVLYARVTTGEDPVHIQARAERAGIIIDEVIVDDVVLRTRIRLCERPGGKRLYDQLGAGDVLVVQWIYSLGQNYKDVAVLLRDFVARGVIVRTLINSLVFDETIRGKKWIERLEEAGCKEATWEARDEGGAPPKLNRWGFFDGENCFSVNEVGQVMELLVIFSNLYYVATCVRLQARDISAMENGPINAYQRMSLWSVACPTSLSRETVYHGKTLL